MRLKRIIRRRLYDSDGTVIGDVNAALSMNVGEPGGSETHVSSNSRVVQRTRSAQASDTTSPAPPADADEPKENA